MVSRKKQITLAEIAKQLGVSTATVSLALQNKPGISEKTRLDVLEMAKRLGYVYNRSAARLRMQRSFTIGLIVPNLLNPFFTELTNSVEERIEAEGLSLLLAKTSEDPHRQQKAVQSMLEYRVDGLLICPAIGTRAADLQILLDARLPFVLYTRSLKGLPADYVGTHNKKGTQIATEFLLKRGHRRIAFIGGLSTSLTRKERFAGFRDALQKAGIPLIDTLNIPCETSIKGGYESIQLALRSQPNPSAVVCYNDIVAFGVILGLWASRIAPGKEFPVIGFDNIADASIWSPPLTTLSAPPGLIGQEAVKLLLKRISSPDSPPEKVILSPTLVVRESCT
ncbi:MAG: LacI family DNA-binding transcriptional regulator [Spirochaetes bacterium]|nr:LacI family DNA-binding transcriptional regulator [Spirochaetota bacterium]